MAFCTSCGSQNPEGAAHCTACGTALVAAPAQAAATPGVPGPMAAAAVHTGPNALQQIVAGLDTGGKVAGVGGIVAAVAFFLPLWTDSNGVNMASGNVTWWFRLLLSLAAVGLLYFAYNNDLRTKIIVATAHVSIGSIWGFALLNVTRGAEYSDGVQFGWYFLHLGMLAIFVGGVMSILGYTKRLVGVR